MQSSRASPPPLRATPSPPTDRSHTTQSPIPRQRPTESMMPYCPVDHHRALPSASTYQDAVPRQYAASWDAPVLDAGASSEHLSSTPSNPLGMVTPGNEGSVSHVHVAPRSVNNTYSYYGDAGVLDDMFPSDPSTNSAGNRQVDGDWVNMRPSVESFTAQDQSQDIQNRDRFIPDHARYVPVEANHVTPAPVIDAFNDNVQQAAAGDPAPGAPAFLDEVPHQGPVPNGRTSEVLRQLALLYLNDPYSQIVMIRMGPGHGDEVIVDFTLKLTIL